MLNTTIYLRHDLRVRLNEIGNDVGVKPAVIIKKALKKYTHKLCKKSFVYRLIQYQEKNRGYSRFHISWTPVENEKLCDLKRVCKFSVSLMVALALEYYFSPTEDEGEVDNYQNNDYTFVSKKEENVISYHFYWGKQNYKALKT